MSIPDYQSLMLPLLRIIGDKAEHTLPEVCASIADEFKLTDAERNEMLPSGGQLKLYNRVGWSRTYMTKAGLIETISRGKFRITPRGEELLHSNQTRIDTEFLMRYPEFVEFRSKESEVKTIPVSPISENTHSSKCVIPQQTPYEMIESGYLSLHEQIAEDFLQKATTCTPRYFEKLVVDLLVAMGYGGSYREAAAKITGKSGDDGIDGVINEDRLGLDVVHIQAKRWTKTTVGRPEVQSFAGSLEGQRSRKGVFITTSQFSDEAKEYVNRIEKKIILIDGKRLADLCIEFQIGVAPVTTFKVNRIDVDYFEEE